MTAPESTRCATPHPVRGRHDAPHPDLEVIGEDGAACWTRCKRCGRWFWIETDRTRFQYREEREVDRIGAEAALTGRGTPTAVLELLITHGLPNGPSWELPEGRAGLLAALTPTHSRADRIEALRAAERDSVWTLALDQLEALERATREAANYPAHPFVVDVEGDFSGCHGPFEVAGAVFLARSTEPSLALRITPEAIVEIPLHSQTKSIGCDDRGVLFHATADSREGLALLTADAQIAIEIEAGEGALYADPTGDGDWILYRPKTTNEPIEVRNNQLQRVGHYRFHRHHHEDIPPPPRRAPSGWIVANMIDKSDTSHALCLVDEWFKPIASSGDERGSRYKPTVLGDDRFSTWRSIPGANELELWRRDGSRLIRTHALASRGSAVVGDRLVVLDWSGHLEGRDTDGQLHWRREALGPAAYFARIGDQVIVYSGRKALIIDPSDGATAHHLAEPFLLRLAVDRAGNGYVLAGPDLIIDLTGSLERVRLDAAYRSATTAASSIVLVDPRHEGRYLVVGADGSVRGDFEAPAAMLSVIGSRGGPTLFEPHRLRIAAFAIG